MKKPIILGLTWACFISTIVVSARAAVTEEGRSRFTPWSGYWWPHARGQLLVPLGKYDQLTGKVAAKWEKEHHPPGDNVPKWHGYCHAWSASSLMEVEPVKVIKAGTGPRQLELGVGDQKGLLAVSHGQDVANSYGDRFGDGQGSDDPQDLLPDQLWHLLKLYVKQQGVPLVLDVESAAEVWNYPIYAYQVTYSPQGNDGQHTAAMTVWMADDAVPPEYIGIKVRRQSYQFAFKMRNGAVVMGSGKWTGPSVKDHPDFAWYPYVAIPENPEVDYAVVRNLLGLGPISSTTPPAVDVNSPLRPAPGTTLPSAPAPSTPTPPNTNAPATNPNTVTPSSPPADLPADPDNPAAPPTIESARPDRPAVATAPGTPPRPTAPGTTPPPANPSTPNRPAPANNPPASPRPLVTIPLPSANPATRPNAPALANEPVAGNVERVMVLSPWELVGLIANKTSSFAFDVTVDRFDGGQYAVGDRYSLRVASEREGYLYLLHIDAQGTLSLLYPQPGQPNRVTPGSSFVIPGPKEEWVFQTAAPVGQTRIKAVVTSRPLILSGLLLTEQNQGQLQEQRVAPRQSKVAPLQMFRWHPTQRQAIQQLLVEFQANQAIDPAEYGGLDPKRVLGDFAQDEVAFYIGPAAEGGSSNQRSPDRTKSPPPKNQK